MVVQSNMSEMAAISTTPLHGWRVGANVTGGDGDESYKMMSCYIGYSLAMIDSKSLRRCN